MPKTYSEQKPGDLVLPAANETATLIIRPVPEAGTLIIIMEDDMGVATDLVLDLREAVRLRDLLNLHIPTATTRCHEAADKAGLLWR